MFAERCKSESNMTFSKDSQRFKSGITTSQRTDWQTSTNEGYDSFKWKPNEASVCELGNVHPGVHFLMIGGVFIVALQVHMLTAHKLNENYECKWWARYISNQW